VEKWRSMAGYLRLGGGSGLMFWSIRRPDLVCANHGSAMANRMKRETRSLGALMLDLNLLCVSVVAMCSIEALQGPGQPRLMWGCSKGGAEMSEYPRL
jgi:hypothetical protein